MVFILFTIIYLLNIVNSSLYQIPLIQKILPCGTMNFQYFCAEQTLMTQVYPFMLEILIYNDNYSFTIMRYVDLKTFIVWHQKYWTRCGQIWMPSIWTSLVFYELSANMYYFILFLFVFHLLLFCYTIALLNINRIIIILDFVFILLKYFSVEASSQCTTCRLGRFQKQNTTNTYHKYSQFSCWWSTSTKIPLNKNIKKIDLIFHQKIIIIASVLQHSIPRIHCKFVFYPIQFNVQYLHHQQPQYKVNRN